MATLRTYRVKEMFGPTVQGEGVHAGRACVFLRFVGCNLACTWCDTDFGPAGARELTAADIAERLVALDQPHSRMVVVTGGEPTLQYDATLSDALSAAGFVIHMESNGTRAPAGAVDWLTVSPKLQFGHGQNLDPHACAQASECKLVVDDTVTPAVLAELAARFAHAALVLQPCMDARYDHHLMRTRELVTTHPRWRLSLQIHKLVGLP